jgi:16S rRNA (uracil1498-N3)-methyltransferase
MRQFLLDQVPGPGGRITLDGSDYRYLVQVLRKTPGSSVEARLPDGSLCAFLVDSVDYRSKTVRLVRRERGPDDALVAGVPGPVADSVEAVAEGRFAPGVSMPPLPTVPEGFPAIVLFQWLLKGPKMDQVIRQATETGVSVIVPVSGERCLPRETGRAERWSRIVREARQQSGSPVPTSVAESVPVSSIAGIWRNFSEGKRNAAFVLTEAPLARKTLHEYLVNGVGLVALATGPEGGMSSSELDELSRAGFSCVHFRTNILRAETAALYGIAAVQTAITESEKWQLKG